MKSGSIHDDEVPTGIRLFLMATPSALRCPACGGRAVEGWGQVHLWLGGSTACAQCEESVRSPRASVIVAHGAIFAGMVIVSAYGAELSWAGWLALALTIAVLILWLRFGVHLISGTPVAVRAEPLAVPNRLRRIQRACYSVIAILLITVVPTAIFVASFLVPRDAEPAWIGVALRIAAAHIFSWTMVRISLEREFNRRPPAPRSEA